MYMTIASFFASIAAFIVQFGFLFGGGFGGGNNRDNNNNGGFLIVVMVSGIVYVVSYLLLQALSRYREFAADRGSALITGRPSALASALTKISVRWTRSRSATCAPPRASWPRSTSSRRRSSRPWPRCSRPTRRSRRAWRPSAGYEAQLQGTAR